MPTKHWVYAENVETNADMCHGDLDAFRSLVASEEKLWLSIKAQFEHEGLDYLHLGEVLRECLRNGGATLSAIDEYTPECQWI